jgi:hypothetical protein
MDQSMGKSLNEGVFRDRLRVMIARSLVVFTFIVNLATTIGVIWVALKFGFNQNTGRLSSDEIIETDTIIVGDRLNIKSIDHEQISIVGKSNAKSIQAEISLNPDYTSMQARSFGSSGSNNDQFKFKLDRKLFGVELSSEAHNVKSIQAGIGRGAEEQPDSSGDLSIRSPDEMELSGNLGLNIHAKDITLKSRKGITIVSGENVIDIGASGGLFIPDIQIINQNDDLELNEDANLDGVATKRQLCIQRSDGLLYKAHLDSC